MLGLAAFAGSALVTAILVAALVIVLAVALRRPARRLGGEFGALWGALRPEFKDFVFERWTTQTLQLLVSAMIAFALVGLAWAAGAGVLRAVSLISGLQPGSAGLAGRVHAEQAFSGANWSFSVVLFFVAQIVRAVAGVLLVGTAAGLVGALVGFIFGVPRPVSDPVVAGAAGRSTTDRQRRAWELSTNLTQVSDWLTKIIVGVGLVEAKTGTLAFFAFASTTAAWLFNSLHGSPVLIGAFMVGSWVFGFLFAYLFAQLIVSRLMEFAARQLSSPDDQATATLGGMQPFMEALVPRISRSSRWPDPTPAPTTEQVAAALNFQQITFDDLIARPGTSVAEVRSWARARAILNDYEAAARAYIHLLGMRP